MQGWRGSSSSLMENLNFDDISSSGNPETALPPRYLGNKNVDLVDQEQRNIDCRNACVASSSGAQNEVSHSEVKTECGLSSSPSARAIAGPRSEERQCEPSDIPSLERNRQFLQNPTPSAAPEDFNLNETFFHGNDNFQLIDEFDWPKLNGSENELTPTGVSDMQTHLYGGHKCLLEDDEILSCSFDGPRRSCKRKTMERSFVQPTVGGSSGDLWHSSHIGSSSLPARHDAGNSLSISDPSELANPSVISGLAESSRLIRLRINHPNQESIPASELSAGRSFQHSSVPSSQQISQTSQLFEDDYSLDLMPPPATTRTISRVRRSSIPAPALPQNLRSVRWIAGSSSGSSSLPSSMTFGNVEESRSESISRNTLLQPTFVSLSELRTSVRNPVTISASGDIASASCVGSSSCVHPSAAPLSVSSLNPPPGSSRGSAEFVRQALVSCDAESRGRNSGRSALQPRMRRQGDSELGNLHTQRFQTVSREGRSRHVFSEQVCTVFDRMRRGEMLQLEDFVILDQQMFSGMPDNHDRHRDMRMDVDNMSYEELLALGERIGNVSTGLSEETILNRLKQWKLSINLGASKEAEEPCCICREEYNEGDNIGILDCQHDFHTECIKQWLKLKNLCPICRVTGLEQ